MGHFARECRNNPQGDGGGDRYNGDRRGGGGRDYDRSDDRRDRREDRWALPAMAGTSVLWHLLGTALL